MGRRYILLILFIVTAISPICGSHSTPRSGDTVRLRRIEAKLCEVAQNDPAFQKEIDLSVGKIPLSEMLRNVAKVSGVNLSVNGLEGVIVSSNFTGAKVADLLFFLCKEHDLDIEVVGSIVSIYPLRIPPAPPKEINVRYDTVNHTLGFDLTDDKMIDVVRKITGLSRVNLLVPQSLYYYQLTGFADNLPFDQAVEALAKMNTLNIEKDETGVWNISKPDENSNNSFARIKRFQSDELSIDTFGKITARLNNANVQAVITELCESQRLNYHFITPLNHSVSIFARNMDFYSLLDALLAGTSNSYYIEDSIHVFGANTAEMPLTSYCVIPFRNRSVSRLSETIPSALKTGVEIKEFADLNSIIVSGNQKNISRVENFLKSVDKRIPMITIEVMIVDVKKSKIMEGGINMGLGEGAVKTSGTLSPGISMNFNAQSINNLLNSFNGFGSVNLGKVTPEFYLSMKFLEENGNIELRSTPKLSTLNGHEATLKSGETQHYKEITNNYISSGIGQPTITENYIWKSVDANLSVKIIPYVSLDNHITLDIEIEQTEFIAGTYTQEDAPPATTTRSFKSFIKVENDEIVLLGGLDKHSKEKSAEGLPFIARVPVLKWIFGRTKDNKVDHKLNVFIKPTITY